MRSSADHSEYARYVIINADDFGLDPGVNRGVMEAVERGVVTSASVMANLPAAAEALAWARGTDSAGIGVHLNLTTGRPLCGASAVPSLVSSSGEFVPRRRLWARMWRGAVAADDVRREWRAQIARVVDAGVAVSHLDSHQHIHLLPRLMGIAGRLAREFGITHLRLPRERFVFWPDGGALGTVRLSLRAALSKNPMNRALRAMLAARAARAFAATGCATAGHFQSTFNLFPPRPLNGGEAGWLALLRGLRPGTTEVMCHPGYVTPTLSRYRRITDLGEAEVGALTSPALRQAIEDLDLRLTRFGRLPTATATYGGSDS
jgi:predicted glycoside hydrolase/deacetylase ChbG (UPF0249 family)